MYKSSNLTLSELEADSGVLHTSIIPDMAAQVGHAIENDGFAGPIRLYSPSASLAVLRRLTKKRSRAKPSWHKGMAALDRDYFDVATDPRILDMLTPVLGENIILWGAHLIRKSGNEVHPFHTDAETSAPDGRFVSLWLALENAGPSAGLKFVPGSHKYGTTIQEANFKRGVARHESVGDNVLKAASLFDAAPRVVQPEVGNGLALLFDGRTWHGSHNIEAEGTRTALLLQYASADAPIRIPTSVEWPLAFDEKSRPPVILISGRAPIGINELVAPPPDSEDVPNDIHRLPKAPIEAVRPWDRQPHHQGRTANAEFARSHTSVLAPGATPHALHAHREEELLVFVEGEVEVTIADDKHGKNARRHTLKRGDFVYYAAFAFHTLNNLSDRPVLYSMFHWHNTNVAGKRPMPSAFFAGSEALGRAPDPDNLFQLIFEGPTQWLERLHAHVTILPAGGGYAAHQDAHDVAIVLIEGQVKTLGQTVSAPAMIYHPAGHEHGIRNAGTDPARYVVFELEAGTFTLPSQGRLAALWAKLKTAMRRRS